jgi:hypothetical protein
MATSATTVVCGEEAVSMPNCEQGLAEQIPADNPFGSF